MPSHLTPFLNACKEGRRDEVERLLRREPALAHRRDPRGGWTGLMLAAKFGWAPVVSKLLAAGADVGAANEFKATALHWAAVGGSIEIVDLLLEAAANTGSSTTSSSCSVASLVNAADCFGTTPLIAASRHGQETVVRRLLRAGAPVDAVDKDSMSATWRVACWGKAAVLACLLREGGADFALADRSGRRPLDVARDLDRHDCVALLLEVERGYTLWKARRLREEALLLSGGGGGGGEEGVGTEAGRTPLPAFCAKDRTALPTVEMQLALAPAPESDSDDEGSDSEDDDDDDGGSEDEAAWSTCVAVTGAVMEELPLDVFRELSLYL